MVPQNETLLSLLLHDGDEAKAAEATARPGGLARLGAVGNRGRGAIGAGNLGALRSISLAAAAVVGRNNTSQQRDAERNSRAAQRAAQRAKEVTGKYVVQLVQAASTASDLTEDDQAAETTASLSQAASMFADARSTVLSAVGPAESLRVVARVLTTPAYSTPAAITAKLEAELVAIVRDTELGQLNLPTVSKVEFTHPPTADPPQTREVWVKFRLKFVGEDEQAFWSERLRRPDKLRLKSCPVLATAILIAEAPAQTGSEDAMVAAVAAVLGPYRHLTGPILGSLDDGGATLDSLFAERWLEVQPHLDNMWMHFAELGHIGRALWESCAMVFPSTAVARLGIPYAFPVSRDRCRRVREAEFAEDRQHYSFQTRPPPSVHSVDITADTAVVRGPSAGIGEVGVWVEETRERRWIGWPAQDAAGAAAAAEGEQGDMQLVRVTQIADANLPEDSRGTAPSFELVREEVSAQQLSSVKSLWLTAAVPIAYSCSLYGLQLQSLWLTAAVPMAYSCSPPWLTAAVRMSYNCSPCGLQLQSPMAYSCGERSSFRLHAFRGLTKLVAIAG